MQIGSSAKPESKKGFITALGSKPAPIPKGNRMKVNRLEGVRADFRQCRQHCYYRATMAVAQRIPETVLQEEPKLLMSYDQVRTAEAKRQTHRREPQVIKGSRDPRYAMDFFREWYARAIRSRIEPLKRFARQLRDKIDGVLSHCQYPPQAGPLEGMNNKIKKIKVINRMAYGYRDEEYFFLKTRDTFTGIRG